MEEARAWVAAIQVRSPTSLCFLKSSFDAGSAQIGGQPRPAFTRIEVFSKGEESHEGWEAFTERRTPDFDRFRGS